MPQNDDGKAWAAARPIWTWTLIDITAALLDHDWIMMRRNDRSQELALYRHRSA